MTNNFGLIASKIEKLCSGREHTRRKYEVQVTSGSTGHPVR